MSIRAKEIRPGKGIPAVDARYCVDQYEYIYRDTPADERGKVPLMVRGNSYVVYETAHAYRIERLEI